MISNRVRRTAQNAGSERRKVTRRDEGEKEESRKKKLDTIEFGSVAVALFPFSSIYCSDVMEPNLPISGPTNERTSLIGWSFRL